MPSLGYCPSCGRPRAEDLRFCPRCGYDHELLADREPTDDALKRQVARHAKARVAVGCRTRIGSAIGGVIGLYLGMLAGGSLTSPPNPLLVGFGFLIGLVLGAWLGGWLVLRWMASRSDG